MDFDLLYIKFVQLKLSKIAYLPNKLTNLATLTEIKKQAKNPFRFSKKKKVKKKNLTHHGNLFKVSTA